VRVRVRVRARVRVRVRVRVSPRAPSRQCARGVNSGLDPNPNPNPNPNLTLTLTLTLTLINPTFSTVRRGTPAFVCFCQPWKPAPSYASTIRYRWQSTFLLSILPTPRARCSAFRATRALAIAAFSSALRVAAAASAAAPARTEARWRSVGDGRWRLALSSGLSWRVAIVRKRARALGAACRTPRAASAARVLGSTRAARNHVMS